MARTPDINVCMANDKTYTRKGWVVDHDFSCHGGTVPFIKERCLIGNRLCYEVGSGSFRMTTIGYGNAGARTIEYVTLMDKVRRTGDTAGLSVRDRLRCNGYESQKCRPGPDNGRRDSLDSWQNGFPSAYYKFSSPEADGLGVDKLTWFDTTKLINMYYRGTSMGESNLGGGGFRCDSATYLRGNEGCVFDEVNSLYSPRRGNPKTKETAQHIYDAQHHPGDTHPRKQGKKIPGAVSSGQPLQRAYHDTELRDANRRKAKRTCRAVWPGYSKKGKECDEYPFASTYQGASTAAGNYSARPVTGRDNGKEGSLRGAWYRDERILDFDSFYVHVRN